MSEDYQAAFASIFESLSGMADMLSPSEAFVNGRDAADGMTPEGEKVYMQMLRDRDLETSKAMEVAVGNKPPGWSHPKFDFWKRPEQ